jgi:hypothetical protein
VTLKIYFSHPSLVIYFFATPSIKLKLGQQIGEGLLISNHMGQSLWSANQKHWAQIRSYLLQSFLQVHLSPVTPNCAIVLSQIQFPEPNRHVLTILHRIFLCRTRFFWALKGKGGGLEPITNYRIKHVDTHFFIEVDGDLGEKRRIMNISSIKRIQKCWCSFWVPTSSTYHLIL